MGRVGRLRERVENSNYILVRIPIEIHLFPRGLKGIRMDSSRLPDILGLSETAIEHLREAGLVSVSHPQRHERKNVSTTPP